METSENTGMRLALLRFGGASVSFCSPVRRASGPVVQSDSPAPWHQVPSLAAAILRPWLAGLAKRPIRPLARAMPSKAGAWREARGERREARSLPTMCHKRRMVS